MRNKLLKEISAEELIKDFEELKSVKEIAKKYKVTVCTVYAAFKIINFDCRVRKDIDKILNKDLLEEKYKELGSLKAVSRDLGISSDSIKSYMKKFEIDFKPQIRYEFDKDFFEKETEESFYWAGFIAADGCVKDRKSKNGNRIWEISLCLAELDEGHLNKFKENLNSNHPIHKKTIKNSKRNANHKDTVAYEITLVSEKMTKDLEKFNIFPRKSLVYDMPEYIINHNLVHHFMRGYNDGDGSFFTSLRKGRKTEQKYFSLVGTKNFLTNYRNILEKNCNIKKRTREVRERKSQYILEYGGNGILSKISNYLYKDATIYLDRKYDKIKHLIINT